MKTRSPIRKTRARYFTEYLFNSLVASTIAVLFFESWGGRSSFALEPVWTTMPSWALLANILVLWMGIVFVAAITCRPRLSILATVDAYALIFLLHGEKIEHLKVPLMITDVFGWREAFLVGMRVLSWTDWGILVALVAIPFLTLAFPVIFPPFPGTRLFHVGLTVVTVGFFVTFLMPGTTWNRWLAGYGRVDRSTTPGPETREQGLLLTQALSLARLRLDGPSSYDSTSVANVLRPFRELAQAPAVAEPIDVVVYAMEGFTDPMRWTEPPAEDPIPVFRAESALHSSGVLAVPVTGSDTGQVEFELLTGFPSTFLPLPTVPFQRYVHRNLDALPRVFARYGYRAIAIHPEPKHVLSRGLVFPRLGFTEYLSQESFPSGSVPSNDESVVDLVLEELDPDAAHFILAVTEAPAVAATAPVAHAQGSYLHRVRDSDAALGRLLATIRTRSRKTIVIAFGTYVPALPGIEKLLGGDREALFRTPLLVWSNFPREREALDENVLFLGARALAWSWVPAPPAYGFLRSASEKIAVLRSDVLRDRSGGVFPADGQRWQNSKAEVSPWVRSLWLLEYDQLFGSGYSVPPPENVAARLPPMPTAAGVRVITSDQVIEATPIPSAPLVPSAGNAKARSASPTGP